MSVRVRNHLLLIAGIVAASFLIGFRPIRWLSEKPHLNDRYTVTFSKPMGADDAARQKLLEQIRSDLQKRTGMLKDLRFDGPTAMTIDTVEPLQKDQEQADAKHIQQQLQKQDAKVTIAAGTGVQKTGPQPVARLGPIAIFRPVPQVNLGLDLQGGAHVVMECLPRTEMRFEAPQGKSFTTPVGDEAAPSAASGKKPEGAKAGQEPAKPEAAKAGEEPTEPEAPKAGEEPSKPEAAKAGEQPVKPEAEGPARAAGQSEPTESPAALQGKLEAALAAAGMQNVQVSIPSSTIVDLVSAARSKDEAKQQQTIVLNELKQLYPSLQITAQAPESVFVETRPGQPSTADQVKHIIDLKLYAMSGVKEPIVQKQGDSRVIVEIPGMQNAADMERVKGILRKEANLEFKLVPANLKVQENQATQERTWTNSDTKQIVQESQVVALSQTKFRGRDLKSNSTVIPGQRADYEVQFTLKDDQQLAFHDFTRRNVGRIMAIVLDGEVQMAPVIQSAIPGTGTIQGGMDMKQASDLKLLLNAGALPVPLKVVEDRSVSPTLGTDSIQKSVRAGLLGFAIVALFMIAYYRVPGVMADVALVLYVVLFMAVLVLGNATLTLPGVAGFILSIGMAVDANVIIFERLKEELRVRSTARAAVEAGFSRAWTAIVDSNVTTLIGAAVLYWLGTATIKSFAVTLFWGVLVSMFSAITVSRWLVMALATSRIGDKLAIYGPVRRARTAAQPAGR